MAIERVPAGDDRCDAHNDRDPLNVICESCLDDLIRDSVLDSAAS